VTTENRLTEDPFIEVNLSKPAVTLETLPMRSPLNLGPPIQIVFMERRLHCTSCFNRMAKSIYSKLNKPRTPLERREAAPTSSISHGQC
jgi:hypothetical protein